MSSWKTRWGSSGKINWPSSCAKAKSEMNESEISGQLPSSYDEIARKISERQRQENLYCSRDWQMRHEGWNLVSTLLVAIIIAGCESNNAPQAPVVLPPVIQRVDVYPDVPSDLLTCLPEPIVPASLTASDSLDRDAVAYEAASRLAGADCRGKLMLLRELVATWPKD